MAKRLSQIKGTAKQMAEAAKSVIIEQPVINALCLEITGSSPLIQNNFSQKALEEMLRKHMGLSVQRGKKVPNEVIAAARIVNTAEAVCVPPAGIKKAMLTASTDLKTFKKTQLRTSLFVEGNSIQITYGSEVNRMDMVRTSGIARTPDVRFRPMFVDWRARLVIQFSDTIAPQSVVDLLNRAGRVGLCEWRPEKNGNFGTFYVTRAITDPEEIAEVRDICAPTLKALQIPQWALNADIDPETLAKVMEEQNIEKAG